MKKTKNNAYDTVISPALAQYFGEGYAEYRIILFSAPCGCGKTVCARELLREKNFCEWNAADPGLFRKKIPKDCEAVLIDDLQYLTDPEQREQLCSLMAQRKDLHFILLGRCSLPGYLMPFKVTGNMLILEMKDLFLDRETALQMLQNHGIAPAPPEISRILKDTKGYPLALEMICRHLADEKKYNDSVYHAGVKEVQTYLAEAVLGRLGKPARSLLLDIAPFDRFSLGLAKMVSGNPHAGEIFGRLETDTSMMLQGGPDQYRFHPIFRGMLLRENERSRTDEERKEILCRAALYYELQGDTGKALELYAGAGANGKISSLLIKNAEYHPGTDYYRELQNYYDALSEEEIRSSSSLMCAMSMLSAIRLDFDTSEKWYAELKAYASGLEKNDPEYQDAMGRLIYLDIGLPQRTSAGLKDIIRRAFRDLPEKKLKIPAFSVTGTLPGIVNGGRDLCEWSKKDTLLYTTMRKPLETVLGRGGVGLAECAICEIRFEKGQNVADEMLNLMARLGEIQARGTPDIEFAVTGLCARIQVSQGKPEAAVATVRSLYTRFEQSGEKRFFGNMEALLTRIYLRTGDTEAVRKWLQTAPGNEASLWPMWGYRYLTRAMVQIAEGKPEEAMLLLSRLCPYCEKGGRIMDSLQIRILMAVCRHGQKDSRWQEELRTALDTGLEYDFVWPFAQYGAALLPLLKSCGWEKDQTFLKKLTDETRTQAILYPKFLKKQAAPTEQLSQMEAQVLRLICWNLSNAEICEIMDIRISTVKTHIRNIFQKLHARSRAEAKETAERLQLV